MDKILTINPGLIFWTILSFLTLVAILKKLAWGPILASLEKREKSISDAVLAAEAAESRAAALLAEQKALFAKAAADAEAVRERALRQAETRAAEVHAEARTKADEMLESARRTIAQEEERAVAMIRKEAVDLAIGGAGKLLGRTVDSQDNRRLVEDFIRATEKKEIG